MARHSYNFLTVFVLFILVQFSSCRSENQELYKKQERPTALESLPRGSRREFIPSGLWFGPRLGRRKRKGPESYLDQDGLNVLEHLAYANERAKPQNNDDYAYDIPNIVKALDAMASKRYFSPRLGRELEEYDDVYTRNVNFIPRLGRETGQDVYDDGAYGLRSTDDVVSRPPNFSPRLGRTVNYPPPRLGREINELFMKDQLKNSRYTRSIENGDKTSKS